MKVFEIEPGLKSLLYVCLFVFFNWKIIALQCVGFWHIATEVSHSHIYVCMPLRLEPRGPLECHGARAGLRGGSAASPWLSVLHSGVRMWRCYFLNSSHPLPSLLCSQVSSLLSVSIPSLQVGASVSRF